MCEYKGKCVLQIYHMIFIFYFHICPVKVYMLTILMCQVRIRATGNGVAVLQVNNEYNLDVTSAWPAFVLNPQELYFFIALNF